MQDIWYSKGRLNDSVFLSPSSCTKRSILFGQGNLIDACINNSKLRSSIKDLRWNNHQLLHRITIVKTPLIYNIGNIASNNRPLVLGEVWFFWMWFRYEMSKKCYVTLSWPLSLPCVIWWHFCEPPTREHFRGAKLHWHKYTESINTEPSP